VHFPGDPTVETATYKAEDGRTFPTHVFSVKQEPGVFKVTVVDMPGKQTGSDAAVMKEAIKAVTDGGAIKFDIPHRVRAVYGRQLGIAEQTVASPMWRSSIGIAASTRSRATPLSLAGRQKLRRCASSSRLISPDQAKAEPSGSRHMSVEGSFLIWRPAAEDLV
jgi:hypothetical protein